MERNPIYLIIVPRANPYNDCVLQVRTSLNSLESFRFERMVAGGDLVLKVPQPIIEIATGRRDDLFGQANKLFGARWGAWKSEGDHVWSYQIQGETDLKPPLTDREQSILSSLEQSPKTFDQIFQALPANSESNLRSALRFLYESGYVLQDGSEYTIRRS